MSLFTFMNYDLHENKYSVFYTTYLSSTLFDCFCMVIHAYKLILQLNQCFSFHFSYLVVYIYNKSFIDTLGLLLSRSSHDLQCKVQTFIMFGLCIASYIIMSIRTLIYVPIYQYAVSYITEQRINMLAFSTYNTSSADFA